MTREGCIVQAPSLPPVRKPALKGRLSSIATMVYVVYILQSKLDGSFYVGHTADLRERIQRHNDGRSTYTKTKVPWKLIYQEHFLSRSEASKREREIKGKRNRAYIEQLVGASRA